METAMEIKEFQGRCEIRRNAEKNEEEKEIGADWRRTVLGAN